MMLTIDDIAAGVAPEAAGLVWEGDTNSAYPGAVYATRMTDLE